MSDDGGIRIRDDRESGRLTAYEGDDGADGGEAVGRVEYFVLEEPGRALVPVHTIVEPAHEGKGIAGALVREFYAIAGREGLPVAPLCPYVVKWAGRHPEEAPESDEALVRAAEEWVTAHPERF
jgi:predicted GNAT family acetyltransferase